MHDLISHIKLSSAYIQEPISFYKTIYKGISVKHLQLFFLYTFLALISISSAHAEEDLTGMDRVYLVITTSDMADAFITLTNYRETEKGGSYTTHIETMEFIEANYEGVDRAEKVRNYIKYSYKNHGTRFVVLGGDADGDMENHKVPMRGLYQKHEDNGVVMAEDLSVPSDKYYAYLDGSFNSDGDQNWGEIDDGADLFPENKNLDWGYEVAVGRIAADNSVEAFNHINKIISFEAQNLPGTSLLVGEQLAYHEPAWGGDNLDNLHICNDSTKLYERDLDSPWTSFDLIELINTNQYSMLHHSGHSNYGDYNSALKIHIYDIHLLKNQKPIFIYTQGGYAAAIDKENSFAEVITNSKPTGGAAAIIGSSRQSWFEEYNEGSIRVHYSFQEFQYNYKYPIGVNLLIADLETRYGGYSSSDRWAALSSVLIGDPATQIYKPEIINAPIIKSFNGTIKYEDGVAKGINIRAEATDEDYDLHTITIFLNQKTLLTKSIDRRGSDSEYFYLQFAELASGEHCISARADDVHGNFSPMSKKVCFTIEDKSEPEITDVEINMHPDIREIIAKIVDKDNDVDQVTCIFDGEYTTNAFLPPYNDDPTLWECPVPDLLLDREHQVTIQAKDEAGLLSDISGPHTFRFYHLPEFTIEVDTSTPELAVISGTAFDRDGDLDKIIMQFGSSNQWVTAEGLENYSYHAYLRPGNHRVTVKAIDKQGYLWTKHENFTVIATACTQYTATNIEHESAGRAYTKTEMTGGMCWGNFCWGQKETTTWFAVGSDNNMGITGDSETTISEKQAGHFSVGSCPANSYAPVATINDWSSEEGNLIITGTATDPNGDLQGVTLHGAGINENCELKGSTFNCTVNGLIDGDYAFYVTAYDALGNNSSPSDSITVTVGAIDNCITATNYQHTNDGRAYAGGTLNLYAFAQGSSNELGLLGSNYYSTTTSLRETSTGYWERVGSCN